MGDVVFDNSQYYLLNSLTRSEEFGDEVVLSGDQETVTQFSVEYFGDFVPRGEEFARVRFYANDGPDIDPRPNKHIPSPGTVLFDSGKLPLGPGFNALLLHGLSVKVPREMIWTLQFSGLQFTSGNTARILFYDPPTVGSSYDDFWVNTTNGWLLYRLGGKPVANFGSRLVTKETPALDIGSPERLASGDLKLSITGPLGRSLVLECSTNATDWAPLGTLTLTNRTVSYIHEGGAALEKPMYRGSLLAETEMRITSALMQTNGDVKLVFSGPMDGYYRLEGSPDLLTWTPLETNLFPAGFGYLTTAAKAPTRFFRLGLLPPTPLTLVKESSVSMNGLFQVGASGAPARLFVVQASTNLVDWTSIGTNMLSVTTGGATVVDLQARTNTLRFYRVLPLVEP